jgi:hypothetical protein
MFGRNSAAKRQVLASTRPTDSRYLFLFWAAVGARIMAFSAARTNARPTTCVFFERKNQMNANQRSQENNQTDNGANEKWTAGSQGRTTDGPMDHTYPAGASQQQGKPTGGGAGTRQSGMGPGQQGTSQDQASQSPMQNGSMQTQQTGGTGTGQGITDSHQRAMEQRSQASGQLEQAAGAGTRQQGSAVAKQQSDKQPGTQGGGQPGLQGSSQPAQRSGSMGNQQSRNASDTQGGGQRGPQRGAMGGAQSTDRAGSQTGGSRQQAGPAVHESNDAAGGYPRSPGGANKLAADEKMDPDTGFSNTANRQQQVDEGSKQVEQSNVGRRDDMTPD